MKIPASTRSLTAHGRLQHGRFIALCTLLLLSLHLPACQGVSGSSPTQNGQADRPGMPGTTPPGGGGVDMGAGGGKPGWAQGDMGQMDVGTAEPEGPIVHTPIHRLNTTEMRNTVRDIFGEAPLKHLQYFDDPDLQGLDTHAASLQFQDTQIADWVDVSIRMADAVNITTHFGRCPSEMEARACAKERIDRLGYQMFRRPLLATETQGFLALYDATLAQGKDDAYALRTIIARMLNSPNFLYHVEVGGADGELTPHEFVQRLSYFAWETTPSQELLDAAASGALGSAQGRAKVIDTVLADERTVSTMVRFFELWIGLDRLASMTKDTELYPEWEGVRDHFGQEFREQVKAMVQKNAPLKELFSSTTTMANSTLREFYGIEHPASAQMGDDATFLPVSSGANRRGILSGGAFLALHAKTARTAPVLRGQFVREHVLCSPLGSPPPGADAQRPQGLAKDLTDRQYWEASTAGGTCQGCHQHLNPIGFTFENFDAIGAWRQMDHGQPVDATGALTGLGAPVAVGGYVEMVEKLAASPQMTQCMVRFWFRSRARRFETPKDEAMLAGWIASMESEQGGVRLGDMARVIATSEMFGQAGFLPP